MQPLKEVRAEPGWVDRRETGASGTEARAGRASKRVPHRLGDLCRYIERTHHAFARDALSHVGPLTDEAALKCGRAIPDLFRLRAMVTALAQDLLPHMMKEERVLFPYWRALDGTNQSLRPPFGTVAIPIEVMRAEHQELVTLFDAVDRICESLSERFRSDGDNPDVEPAAAVDWYDDEGRALVSALRELVSDLREHVRLEDEVLFPRALNAERSRSQASPALHR